MNCPNCGAPMKETDSFCDQCGTPNPTKPKRPQDIVPKTIEELRQWYQDRNLPPEETTRFFIGTNYQGAKAFGIYQEGDRFVVYKNKADGSRAVRYNGPDEAYAVKELYERLKLEIANQKANQSSKKTELTPKEKAYSVGAIAAVVVLTVAIIGYVIHDVIHTPSRGYYDYNDHLYYYLSDTWYDYVDNVWYPTQVDSALNEGWNDYYQGSNYQSSYQVSDFTETSYYSEYEESHNSSDWSSSDSWDSGSTDWSSDW